MMLNMLTLSFTSLHVYAEIQGSFFPTLEEACR